MSKLLSETQLEQGAEAWGLAVRLLRFGGVASCPGAVSAVLGGYLLSDG